MCQPAAPCPSGAPLTYLASEGAAFVLATLLAQHLSAKALALPAALRPSSRWLHALPFGHPTPPSRQNSPPRLRPASPVGAELAPGGPAVGVSPGGPPTRAAASTASGLEDESAAAERAAVDAGTHGGNCNPTPHAEAATLCRGGCDPTLWRL